MEELMVADAIGNQNQFLGQPAEAMILFQLLTGSLHRRTRRDHVGDRLAVHRVSEGERRAVSLVALLGAVAGRLPAFAKTRNQRTGAHIADLAQLSDELLALQKQGVQGGGYGGRHD